MLERAKAAIDALRKMRSAPNILADSLAQVRSQIEDLKVKREEIADMPVDKATAEARATAFMQREILSARQHVDDPSRFTKADQGWQAAPGRQFDFGAIALAYLGDQLIDAINDQVGQIYEDITGIADDERKKLLDVTDQQLLDAELAEEAIIRHAEAHGFAVDRRIEADPRAVLAADEALP